MTIHYVQNMKKKLLSFSLFFFLHQAMVSFTSFLFFEGNNR